MEWGIDKGSLRYTKNYAVMKPTELTNVVMKPTELPTTQGQPNPRKNMPGIG